MQTKNSAQNAHQSEFHSQNEREIQSTQGLASQTRREFVKNSAKVGAGVAILGTSALLSPANAAPTTKVVPQNAAASEILAQAQNGERISSKGYAAYGKDFKFKPYSFSRHPLGANDILIQILYAGICHSDLHAVAGEHGAANYPMVPGHEIAGRVIAVGNKVSKFKVGDYAGVGCMVNSCGECEACRASNEQFCQNARTVFTYNSVDVFHGSEITYGGYSNNYVVSENFAIKVPKNAQIEKVAPLLCAGITTYSPIMYSKVSKGQKVAVAGVGGLGHMAVKYMVALGAEVTGFDIVDKRQSVLKLGAKRFINVNDKEFTQINNEFDFIISTIPYHYDINAYQKMLKLNGEMAIVGLPNAKNNPNLDANAMIWQFRRKIYSSLIGGIKETQEMLDFSVKNGIYPQIELIPISEINNTYKKVAKGEANFRFVIDMKSLV